MEPTHYLAHLVKLQKQGIPQGLCSICSAHPFVIEAALEKGLHDNTYVLIEATCNQVNQFGGYTGMKPWDFVEFVCSIANTVRFPLEKIIFGGDHLGPNPWKDENAETAMAKACELVREYASAGFTKIHLDTSMYLADDPGDRTKPLDPRLVAERSAVLCSIVEEVATENRTQKTEGKRQMGSEKLPPVYVIGTEVPVPGGIQGDSEELHITEAADFKETVKTSQEAFYKRGLFDAWERVIAVVVQPGVEYGDHAIYEYQREKARALCDTLKEFSSLVFEGHSTDYQRPSQLKQMVEDGIAILKVGPALTFAMREAVFMLQSIENELLYNNSVFQRSNLINILDETMVNNPVYWKHYYHGNRNEVQFARKYSFSDRSRYYWTDPKVQQALHRLFNNLERIKIPLPLISQFFPRQYERIREGVLEADPKSLVKDRINDVLRIYSDAITHESR